MHTDLRTAAAMPLGSAPDPIVSSASAGGARVAAALARRAQQSLIVVDPIAPLAAATIAGAPVALPDVLATELLSRAESDRSGGERGVETENRAVCALPAIALTEMARAESASLIVIEGGPRPPRSLLRSLPLRTALRAAAPVLAVRESDSLLRWLGRESILRVLVAIDRSDAARTALDWASAFAGALPVEVVAAGLDPSVCPRDWDGAKAVLDTATRWKAELVVVAIRRGGPFASWRRRSAAERLVDDAPMNVVAVPCV